MQRNESRLIFGVVLVLLMTSGCLKTRAQLRSESEQASAAVPSKVQQSDEESRYAIDELKGEMTRLVGRVEDLERAQNEKQFDLSQDESYRKLNDRVAELERTQVAILEAIKKLQGSASVDQPTLFEDARKAYDQGDCESAIASLDKYLTASQPKQAENAYYMRADCYYQQKQYKKAIVDYSKFPERFSRSKYMAASLYKIGLSFEAMGMKEDARSFFQELVDKFPKSTEAKRAKLKLK